MPKQIKTGKQAREKLLSGISQIAEPVIITLGPKGRNVGIEKTWTEPTVLHDGVSVAKEIDLPDPFENFGAQLIRQAAAKTSDISGDGTTTSMLLAYEMIKRGIPAVNNGLNPMIIKKGMDKAVKIAIEAIEKKSKPVKTQEEMAQVATISSADEEIGGKIGEAMFKVGKDGVISSEVYAGLEIAVEYKEGMEFDKGYISSQFVNIPEKGEALVENPYILITDMAISSGQEIAGFLERFVKATGQKDIVIIASDIGGTALLTLLANQIRGNVNSLAIFAPAFADRRKDILEDIATLTGGQFISKDLNITIDKLFETDEQGNIVSGAEKLGRADSVWSNDKTTRIVGGFGDTQKISARADKIKEQIKKEESDFEKEKLQDRLAKLISGAAIIKVGAKTEVELSDRKERVIDAVEATKAAVLEGIVAGGGLTLLGIVDILNKQKLPNAEEQVGLVIVQEALVEPALKILANAGKGNEVFDKLDPEKEWGYNVMTEEFGDLFKLGIIDPTRVVKEALQNAVSVAGAILCCEAIVCKIPEEVKAPQN